MVYGIVVRLRFDLEFPEPLPERLGVVSGTQKNVVVVPAARGHGGVNDKFAAGDRDAMAAYARLLAVLSALLPSFQYDSRRSQRVIIRTTRSSSARAALAVPSKTASSRWFPVVVVVSD